MEKHQDKKKNIRKIAQILEGFLAGITLLLVILGTIDIGREIIHTYILNYNTLSTYEEINTMVGQVLILAIGLGIAKMLVLHKEWAVLDVLLYSTARKVLLGNHHNVMLGILIGVLSIGVLFAIRKYLLKDNHNI